MRKLFFGGSFNPIHHGHLVTSRAVAEKLGYDRLCLIPTNQAPHKAPSANMAAAGHRLKMANLAILGDPVFEVDDLELKREPPSYTWDTAQVLRSRGYENVDWLIGADMLLYLPHWHNALQLISQVRFIVMARPGWTLDWDAMPPAFQHLRANVVEAPMISLGATEIRARVAAGLPIRYLVPESVRAYIEQHQLYR